MTDACAPAGLLRRAGAFGLDYLVIAAYLVLVLAVAALVDARRRTVHDRAARTRVVAIPTDQRALSAARDGAASLLDAGPMPNPRARPRGRG